MNRQSANHRYGDLHADAPYHDGAFKRFTKEPTPATPYHFQDGVEIFVTDVDYGLGGDFLTAPDPFGSAESDQQGGSDGNAS